MDFSISHVADPIITKIINELSSFTKKKYHELYGVEGEIENLTSNLQSIKAVLNDAQRKLYDSDSEQLADWLTKLRAAALDAEDILETYAAEAFLREKKKRPDPLAWVHSRLDAAKKIKKVVATIGIISKEKNDFHFRERDYGVTREYTPQTTRNGLREMLSFRERSDIIGRENEKDEIVKWLLSSQGSCNEGSIPVIPIIGMGGLGKTTLAQLVYNDNRVYNKDEESGHFKVRMWVSVTINFNLHRILQKMAEILTEMRHDGVPESSIRSRILEALDGRTFLLVLDDIWPETLDWETLHRFLRQGARGSKVLVTSRSQHVAQRMSATHSHSLGGLPEEECWSLFAKIAFKDGEPSKDQEDIGRQIVTKCNCLPLAVKAMAGLLRGIDDVNKWERILRNGVWEAELLDLGNGAPNILPSLKLSYNHLPPTLKQCFAYCYILPKGYMFDRSELIKLWVGEGFILSQGQDKLEETGGDYFDELLMRSFFQRLEIDSCERYKMHDLIHDLAKSVSSSCYQVEEDDAHSILIDSRHISLLCKDVQGPSREVLKATKLRTLLSPTSYLKDFGQSLDKMFRSLPYLRILDLSSSTVVDLPKSIGQLKLLRYLDLSRTEIRALPNTICDLYNLQTLKLLGCLWLLELQKDLGNLENLRHLELDAMFWFKCSTSPPRIGALTVLHNLHLFRVGHQKGYGIEELKGMKYLQGTLHISNLENVKQAERAELKEKKNLHRLVLEWSNEGTSQQDQTVQERELENLQPHRRLQELELHHYKGSTLPTWLVNGSLQNLTKISLKNCVKCRNLSLGQFPSLRELRLKGMQDLEEWQDNGYHSLSWLQITKCPKLRALPKCIFPNLRVMKIKHCSMLKALPKAPSLTFLILIDNIVLEEWNEAMVPIVTRTQEGRELLQGLPSFLHLLELKLVNSPRLQELPRIFAPQKLEISDCTSLRSLPLQQHSQRLQHLALDTSNTTTLVEAIPRTNSLYSLVISNIANMVHLPNWPTLQELKALYLHDCEDLEALSDGQNGPLQSVTSLKLLSLRGCPSLRVGLPNEGLPSSLECLTIGKCSNLESLGPDDCLTRLTSLNDLYLEECPKLEFLPEGGFPVSLQHVCIKGCSLLMRHCSEETKGRYWPMIRDIVDLELDFVQVTNQRAPPPTQNRCCHCFGWM